MSGDDSGNCRPSVRRRPPIEIICQCFVGQRAPFSLDVHARRRSNISKTISTVRRPYDLQ